MIRNYRRKAPLVLAGIVALMAFSASVTQAGISVSYDMGAAILDYKLSGRVLTVTEGAGSVLDMLAVENVFPFGNTDSARIDGGGDFDLTVALTLVRVSANVYTATGTFTIKDFGGTTGIKADFTSTSISIIGGKLEILGNLVKLGSETSILVGSGPDPWVFDGELDVPGEPDGDTDLKVFGADAYDHGDLTTLKFGLGSSTTLDQVFNVGDLTLSGGEVKGQIIPAPGAILLGALGVGLVTRLRRRLS